MMRCEHCDDAFMPRVTVEAPDIQQALRDFHGKGTSNVDFSSFHLPRILEEGQKDLEDYESKILALQRRRDALAGYLDKCRSLMSPIRRLPDELLGQIFAFYCSEEDLEMNALHRGDSIGYPEPRQTHLITLIGISSHWRQVILSTPSLWADIRMYSSPFYSCTDEDEMAPGVVYFLQRSKQSLLTVFFTTERPIIDGSPYRKASNVEAFDLLIGQSHRWQNLTLDPHTLSFMLQQDETVPLPSLESLTLTNNVNDRSGLAPGMYRSVVNRMPRLCSLSVYMELDPDDAVLPWHQITKLDIGDGHSNALRLLRLCANLTELTITSFGPDKAFRPIRNAKALESLVLSQVRSLRLYSPSPRSRAFTSSSRHSSYPFVQLLKFLTMPNLTVLELASDGASSCINLPAEDMYRFLVRSPHLRALHLAHVDILDNGLLWCLDVLPSVTDLSIHDSPKHWRDCDGAASAFVQCRILPDHLDPQFRPILPNLKRLSLKVRDLDETLFVDMVKSRSIPTFHEKTSVSVAALRFVQVQISRPETAALQDLNPTISLHGDNAQSASASDLLLQDDNRDKSDGSTKFSLLDDFKKDGSDTTVLVIADGKVVYNSSRLA